MQHFYDSEQSIPSPEDRPITTLFLLMSIDGKISTGSVDSRDVDRDFPNIPGVAEGLHQYYEIEQTTDLWSLNSGRVQQKMGVNEKPLPPKSPVSFVLLDNTHLTKHGVEYFCAKSDQLVLITGNPNHPGFDVKAENLHILYQSQSDLSDALTRLKQEFGCQHLTVQTGGTLNALLLRQGLIDYVDIVIAPVLIGGRDTATLMDGSSLTTQADLRQLVTLELIACEKLEDSYIRIKYKVKH